MEETIFGYIYCLENIVNQHKYIGQTTLNIGDRVNEHFRISPYRNTAIYNAIKKYGKDNFTYYQLDTATTQEELDDKETYWINYYNTYLGKGYNMTNGGQLEKQNYESQEVIDNYSKFRGGRPFMIFDTDGNYIKTMISQTQFAREIGKDLKYINGCLREIFNVAKGFILIYKDKYSDDLLNQRVEMANKYYQPFAVFNKDTQEYIGVWRDKKKCSIDLNYSHNMIQKLVSGVTYSNVKYNIKYLSKCREDELTIINNPINQSKIHNEILVYKGGNKNE